MLCIFGFVDDVMFSYNGRNRPESKTASMFRLVRQVAAPSATSAVSELFFKRPIHITCSDVQYCELLVQLSSLLSRRCERNFREQAHASPMFTPNLTTVIRQHMNCAMHLDQLS